MAAKSLTAFMEAPRAPLALTSSVTRATPSRRPGSPVPAGGESETDRSTATGESLPVVEARDSAA